MTTWTETDWSKTLGSMSMDDIPSLVDEAVNVTFDEAYAQGLLDGTQDTQLELRKTLTGVFSALEELQENLETLAGMVGDAQAVATDIGKKIEEVL